MKEALLAHLSPQDEMWDARMKIKYIKKARSLQAYQCKFVSMILELHDMVEKENVFKFIIGLKPWARNEVKWQKIKTLQE